MKKFKIGFIIGIIVLVLFALVCKDADTAILVIYGENQIDEILLKVIKDFAYSGNLAAVMYIKWFSIALMVIDIVVMGICAIKGIKKR